MKRPFFILLLLFPFCLFSQKEVNIWYFGNKAGLDFNSCSGVTVLNNSAMVAKEGTAVMSDANGWPGTFRGRACDPGVYAYQLTYISNTGAEKLLKGNITLVR